MARILPLLVICYVALAIGSSARAPVEILQTLGICYA